MKNQIRAHIERNLVRRGADPKTAAFSEILDRLTTVAGNEYDRLVAAGRTDLDAYRGAMETVEAEADRAAVFLKATGGDLPVDEEPEEKKKEKSDSLSPVEQAAHAVLWLLTLVGYFVLSFLTGWWRLTWVVFLSAAAGSIIIGMIFAINRGHTLGEEWDDLQGVVWMVTLTVYFIVSFLTGKWGATWLIFIGGVALTVILGAVGSVVKRKEKENGAGGENED